MGPVSIGVEVQRNFDGDTPSMYRSENGMQVSQPTSILCTAKTRRRILLTIIITANNVDSDEYQPSGPAACKVGLKQTV